MKEMQEISEKILKCCKKHNINKEIFLFGNGSKQFKEKLVFDCSEREIHDSCKYIVQYFREINAIVIWDREKHKQETKKFTIKKEDVLNGLKKKKAYKGVEYRAWDMTEVFVAKADELEELLDNIIKKR